ncbi:MAG: hypothetical protein J6N52_11180 [Clostridia bacterium]|nr:hypothetical protein [Clostridia bacterium]
MKKAIEKKCEWLPLIYVGMFIVIAHLVVWMFSGNSPLSPNPYNSYVLQAEAWRDGSLDLGRGYSHLELAEYDYRYFVSFPPFPSVVYYPLVLLGIPVPEGLIALITSVLGGILCCMLLKSCSVSDTCAAVISILTVCGSNLLFVSVNAWVWFIAQNMCFTLTVASLLCAVKKRGFLCFLLWACAVGCRPFQILYLPLLCLILMKSCGSGIRLFVSKPHWFAGAAVLAAFYMWLNYARFGNIFEFGHNYLPEFTQAEKGQFNIAYMKTNLYSLIRLPMLSSSGALKMQQFDGMNMFLVSPVFIYAVCLYFADFKNNRLIKTAALITIIAELLAITAHKTMGGWQFGNRYTVDCIPAALLIAAMSCRRQHPAPALTLLTVFGVLFNLAGTVLCYLDAL